MIRIFNPIVPTAFGTQMSYLEMLQNIVKETEKELNNLNDLIHEVDSKYNTITNNLKSDIDTLDGKVDTEVARLDKLINDTKNQLIADIQKVAGDLVAVRDDLQGKIDSINTEIANIQAEQVVQNTNIQKNSTDIQKNADDIAGINTSITNIQTEQQAQNTAIQKNADDIADLKTSIIRIDSINELQTSHIAANSNAIVDIQQRLQDVIASSINYVTKSELNDSQTAQDNVTQAHYAEMQGRFNGVQAQLNNNTNTINSITGGVPVEKSLDQINSELTVNDMKVSILELKVSSLDTRVTTLEENGGGGNTPDLTDYVKKTEFESSQNAQDIKIQQNTVDITANAGNIAKNTADIGSLKTGELDSRYVDILAPLMNMTSDMTLYCADDSAEGNENIPKRCNLSSLTDLQVQNMKLLSDIDVTINPIVLIDEANVSLVGITPTNYITRFFDYSNETNNYTGYVIGYDTVSNDVVYFYIDAIISNTFGKVPALKDTTFSSDSKILIENNDGVVRRITLSELKTLLNSF